MPSTITIKSSLDSVAEDSVTPKEQAKRSKQSYMAAMIGNALEYYDNSLYGVMAPLLVAVFLPTFDSVDAYILAYAAYPSSIIPALLGSWFFGWVGDHQGRKPALLMTIWGMTIAAALVGFLPTYATIGIAAPILFILLRMLQKFFTAGEYNGGAIYTQEHVPNRHRGFFSGLYSGFTVVGIIAASIIGTCVAYLPHHFWRLPYLLGLGTAIVGVYLRKSAWESPELLAAKKERPFANKPPAIPWMKLMPRLLSVVAASGFFGAVYCLPTLFLTTFLPLVTTFELPSVMLINTFALIIYMFSLPVAGYASDVWGYKKVMLTGAIATGVLTLPLMGLITFDAVWAIVVLKLGFGLLSAWFIGPFHAWSQQLFDVQYRYRSISIAYNVGAKIGGGSTPAIAFWLWKSTGQLYAPAYVMIAWALLGSLGVLWSRR